MSSLINKSVDWLPRHYHKTAITFPQISWEPNPLTEVTLNEQANTEGLILYMVQDFKFLTDRFEIHFVYTPAPTMPEHSGFSRFTKLTEFSQASKF